MIERIDHIADPRLDDYRNLTDGQMRARRAGFVVEGRLNVRTLLSASRFRPRSILVTDAALESLRDVVDGGGAFGSRPPVYLAPQDLVNQVAGFHVHRGCLAVADRGLPMTLGDVLRGAGAGPATLVVLESVNNHDNVGGVFRNAAAFGAAGVVLSRGCVDPLYRKAVRVSMGGVLRVPFAVANEAAAAAWLEPIRAAGFTLVALSPAAGAIDIGEFGSARPIPGRVALMLGAEGAGLSAEARESANLIARIPIVPGVDSLNVAAASAVALHRFARL